MRHLENAAVGQSVHAVGQSYHLSPICTATNYYKVEYQRNNWRCTLSLHYGLGGDNMLGMVLQKRMIPLRKGDVNLGFCELLLGR